MIDRPPPVDAVTSTLKALLSSPSPSSAPTPVSTFNLSMTDKQRQAKAQLTLPYQHTGGGRGVAVHFGEGGLHFPSAQKGGEVDDDNVFDEDEEIDDDLDDV